MYIFLFTLLGKGDKNDSFCLNFSVRSQSPRANVYVIKVVLKHY